VSRSSAIHKTWALAAVLMAACAAQAEEDSDLSAVAEQVATTGVEAAPSGVAAQESGELAGIWSEFGGLTYGGAVVKWRGGGSVQQCFAGPMGVLLPNRFVHCYCDQLVKDCGQDTSCASCSNPRYEQCASSTWFSSVSYLVGSCNVNELNACAQFCQQSCSPGCS
jgi:hypothetical protein